MKNCYNWFKQPTGAFLLIIIFLVIHATIFAQTSWNITGNSGITSANFIGTTDNRALVFKAKNKERGRIDPTGFWRFGFATNFATIDSAGKLIFGGSGTYLVAGNKYVFQYQDNPAYGLFFNAAIPQYEFRSSKADPVFYVNADNGNGVFLGNLKIGAYTLPAADGTNGQVLSTDGAGAVSWSTITATGANKPLSNLSATTAVNVNLLPGTDNNLNLGSSIKGWKDAYIKRILINGRSFLHNTGTGNTFAGELSGATISTGVNNTALGDSAMYFITTGSGNIAIGKSALLKNITGYSNVAIGISALNNNTTGHNLLAIGDSALYNQGSSLLDLYNNTAIGSKALFSNKLGFSNTATGSSALFSNTSGVGNTANGDHALYADTSGQSNTAIGGYSLFSNITGGGNTALGVSTLQNNISGSDNTAIGYGANVSLGTLNFATALGYNAIADASNKVMIGASTIGSIGGYVDWTNFSDGRYKQNIKQNVPGLAFINKLKPVTYTLNVSSINAKLHQHMQEAGGIGNDKLKEHFLQVAENEKSKIIYTGFVAQEVEKAAAELNYDFSGVDKPKDPNQSFYGLRYGDFVMPLVKAVQELSQQNDELKTQNNNQEKEINELKAMMVQIQQQLRSNIPATALNNNALQQSNITLSNTAILEQNIPNPFTNSTTIGYNIPGKFSSAQIIITDKNGRQLKQVSLSGTGKGTIHIDASTLTSGAYNYSLYTDGKLIATKQMILAK